MLLTDIPQLPAGHEAVWAILVSALAVLVSIYWAVKKLRLEVVEVTDDRIKVVVPSLLDIHKIDDAAHIKMMHIHNSDPLAHAAASEHNHGPMLSILRELENGQTRIEAMLVERQASLSLRLDKLEDSVLSLVKEVANNAKELKKGNFDV
jgi:hypothetical protein